MGFDRRNLIKYGLSLPLGSSLIPGLAFGEDEPKPRSNRFLLQIHLDSMCGVASGLTQPLKVGEWPKGFNEASSNAGSTNPNLNSHTQSGNLIFHSYIKFLQAIAEDMCLVAGTSQSLDHGAAFNLQNRGSNLTVFSPEWSMAVAQFMKTDKRQNPMVLSSGNKTGSVPDIVPVSADTLDDFKTVTRDVSQIPNIVGDPTLTRLKARFAQSSLGSVLLDKNLGNATGYQLDTLAVGLAELSQAQAEIANMDKFFGETNTKALLEGCAEKDVALKTLGFGGAIFPPPNPFREKLKLAGIMAKTGLASGMTISLNRGFEDNHVGGAEVATARNAASYWLLIAEFWQWVKSAKLQDDVMIVITHDFTRTAYNGYKSSSAEVTDLSGKKVNVITPGRDHALAMGMMFINGKVPRSGRVGVVTDNIAPVAGKDTKGGIDLNAQPYLSHNIIGSMLMRVYDDLYPTERMVRKHWPTFQEIPLLSVI